MDKINGIIKNDTVEPDELSAHENDIVTIEGFNPRNDGFFFRDRPHQAGRGAMYLRAGVFRLQVERKHCGKLLGEDYGQGCHQPGREGQQAL